MSLQNILFVLILAGSTLGFSGQYLPKSYYIIDHEGHRSDTIYFRSKRDVELFPLLRLKRSGGDSSSSSSSSQAQSSSHSSGASSSSSSSSSANGGGLFYPEGFGFNPGLIPGFDAAYHNLGRGGGGGGGGQAHSFASSSSSSSSGLPGSGGHGGHGGADNLGYNGPILFSRFGEDTGTGVKVTGSAQGPKGAFSSSSSSIDSNGKIKYSTKSGKY